MAPRESVLVTGGAGFIGSAVVARLLSLGYNATVYDNLVAGVPSNLGEGARLVRGDILHYHSLQAAIRGNRYVIHLAADPFVPESFADPARFWSTNVQGTLNVLRAMDELRFRLVYVSTAEVYGSTAQLRPLKESDPLNPVSPYAKSRAEAEAQVLSAGRSHADSIITLRLFNAFGPRETHPYVIPELVRQALKEPFISVGNTHAYRDFTYVDDTAAAIARPIEIDRFDNTIVNIGTGKTRRIDEVISVILRLADESRKSVVIDPSRLRPLDVPELVAETTLARNVLDWRPRIAFEEGISLMLAWYRSHGNEWVYETSRRVGHWSSRQVITEASASPLAR